MATPKKQRRISEIYENSNRSNVGTVTPSRTNYSNSCNDVAPMVKNISVTILPVTKVPPKEEILTKTDQIYGNVLMESICNEIIDTPEFQRLRELQQLGVASRIFDSANHTRYQHSLGVAYLAEKFAKILKEKHSNLDITNEDVICVKIAGLCHDIGHGPFSHLFEKFNASKEWRHERRSVLMLRHLIASKPIHMESFGLLEKDITFIEEMIEGTEEGERKGRAAEKFFLYDIVNNIRSGFDVDKMDYLLRDSLMTNRAYKKEEYLEFLERAQVMPAKPIDVPHTLQDTNLHYESSQSSSQEDCPWIRLQGRKRGRELEAVKASQSLPLMICFPSDLVGRASDFFHKRFTMHDNIYQNVSVKQYEHMVLDVLRLADKHHMTFPGSVTATHPDGKYRLYEVVQDMVALSQVDDRVLTDIGRHVPEAQKLVLRILRRDVYVHVGKIKFKKGDIIYRAKETDICEGIVQESILLCSGASYANRESDDDDDDENVILDMDHLPLHNEEFSIVSNEYSNCSFTHPNENSPGTSSYSFYDTSFGGHAPLSVAHLIVDKMQLHHGSKEKDPVESMRFFEPNMTNPIGEQADPDSYSSHRPSVFCDHVLRIYCKDSSFLPLAKKAFENWAITNKVQMPTFSQ